MIEIEWTLAVYSPMAHFAVLLVGDPDDDGRLADLERLRTAVQGWWLDKGRPRMMADVLSGIWFELEKSLLAEGRQCSVAWVSYGAEEYRMKFRPTDEDVEALNGE